MLIVRNQAAISIFLSSANPSVSRLFLQLKSNSSPIHSRLKFKYFSSLKAHYKGITIAPMEYTDALFTPL